MGLFSRGKGGGIDFGRVLDGFSAAQATLAGDYGGAASIHHNRNRLRAAERAAQEEAEAERRQRQLQQEALASITDREGNPLFTKQQILGMRPEDISALAREFAQPRQFGPEGGSVLDPRTGTYQQAPWQRQVGRSIVQGGPNGGAPQTIFEGIEPVSVQPGGVVEGWTSRGPAGPPANAPTLGPAPGAVVNGFRFKGGNPNDQNNWEPAGGAGSQAPSPFDPSAIPANFTSGRRTPYGNQLVGGVPNSAHLSGDAADFTPRNGQTMGQLEADLRRRFPNARIINEGDHVHVQQRGWNVPLHGARGTRRGP